MLETSEFEAGEWRVLFLGTAKSQPNDPTCSVFTNTYALINYDEVIFIGAGTGLDLILHPDLRKKRLWGFESTTPLSMFLPNLDQSMIGGLVSSHVLRGTTKRMSMYFPGASRQTLDSELRNIFDQWGFLGFEHVQKIRLLMQDRERITRSCLSLSSERVHRRTTLSGSAVFYCALPNREGVVPRRPTLAFRVGSIVFALCGTLIGNDGLSPACKHLLKNAAHLVVGCSDDVSHGCSMPEEIIQACKEAGCRPTIYVVNHASLNAAQIVQKIEDAYAKIDTKLFRSLKRRVYLGIDALTLRRD